MRPVYDAEHLIDAHLVRGRLMAEGIEARVRGEFLTGALGELPVGGLLQVCVAEDDLAAARALLQEWTQLAATADESASGSALPPDSCGLLA